MDPLTLWNIAAYNAQVAALVVLAWLGSSLLRIDVASARYAFWRAVLALCLLLPMVQGRQTPAVGRGGQASVDTQLSVAAVDVPLQSPAAVDWAAMVVPLLAAGAAARLLWIGMSLLRLRRLRRLGARAPESELRTELQEIIGTRCEVRYVARLRQPVTFGLWRPVILLPASLAERSTDVQRAVLSHELFHVKRRDWGWLLVEETACAFLWFNPAFWWLISRVQLAREVVVDELAVLATGRRRAYVEALMTFADETSLAPVAAFGGRRQLFNRIVLLSKEAVMSSRRLVFTCGLLAATVAAGTWQIVDAFPLTASEAQVARPAGPGPLEQKSVPITPENPIPRRVNYEPPAFPAEARAAGAFASVTVMITLDELGRVAEARRTRLSLKATTPAVSVVFSATNPADEGRFLVNGSRDQSDTVRAIAYAFEDAAIRSVQQWRYDPPAAAPISFPAVVNFLEDGATITGRGRGLAPGNQESNPIWVEGAVRVGGTIKTPMKIRDVRPVYPPEAQAARVSGLVIIEARIGVDGSIEDARVLRSIPLLDQAALDAVMQWRFVPTLLNGQPVPVIMTVTVNFTLQPSSASQPAAAPVEPAVEVKPEGPRPEVVKEVKPKYPKIAMDANVAGTVEMEVTIGTDGKVTDARVIRSIPLLDAAALEAVRQWEFKPPPQTVQVNIEMSFSMLRRGDR